MRSTLKNFNWSWLISYAHTSNSYTYSGITICMIVHMCIHIHTHVQSHYGEDYTQPKEGILTFEAIFAIMFNGCTGIMGKLLELVIVSRSISLSVPPSLPSLSLAPSPIYPSLQLVPIPQESQCSHSPGNPSGMCNHFRCVHYPL